MQRPVSREVYSMNRCIFLKQEGFTLIEVILSIILMGIVGALLVSYLGTSFVRSAEPLQDLDENYEMVQMVENINADYRSQMEAGTFNPDTFRANLTGYVIGGAQVTGNYVSFNNTSEIAHDGSKRFLKITVTQNNKRIVTILSN